MKVMAIGSLTQPLTPEQRAEVMPKEVPHTLKLYLDGKVDQFWFRQDQPGPIFLMNAETVEQAKATTDQMPLVIAGYATYTFIPVGPLAPLGMLIAGK
ncbi:hypothetical protein ACELLULO517_21300 [Acidisoma cellulosilytica]|uniref:Muconolactone isomerase domain-containing protein n=1 Tax=Acidisoma cellulosilyticum TaxID=2802395 RepID=A0A964E5R6_9PROT|nr:hypothetical protein [Acidisoma cellulosilyticum]MCB8882796.1 hypothetical protein [Acidisoma cellulosilyticum]